MGPKAHAALAGSLILRLGLPVIVIVVIVAVSLFCFSIVSDGIDAKLMRFESEPAEGRDYWEQKYHTEALKGWAIPILLTAGTLFLLLGSCCKTISAVGATLTKRNVNHENAGQPDSEAS